MLRTDESPAAEQPAVLLLVLVLIVVAVSTGGARFTETRTLVPGGAYQADILRSYLEFEVPPVARSAF